ncbi:MAG: Gfo/Idh/MocA family oxidoreductase [Bdellovibrionales bacterium]|nr:Gfo/Idh/MocA family oxidoreductase [Bdellovibrionales bacterium]NQZ19779.1 Gfo/Idh/MocA family oxidoreductase [Bdellovibrionales bacterium]
MSKVRTAVIGTGHLGKWHAEKLFKIENSDLVAICDINTETAQELATKFECEVETDYEKLIGRVDAVLIAAPTPLHYKMAKYFLGNSVHVFLEKPITETVAEAQELCDLAADKNLILQVGHVERFNPALVSAQEKLKEPLFIECHRLAPFKPRSTDVDVVLDLMIHDIDVIMSLVNSPVTSVSAVGTPVLTPLVDIANARIEFENKAVANITASRVSQNSKRKFRVFQETQYLSIDFGTGELNLTTKTGEWDDVEEELPLDFDAWSLDKGDALLAEDQAFVDSIQKGVTPEVSGEQGLTALKVAEQIRADIGRRLQSR